MHQHTSPRSEQRTPSAASAAGRRTRPSRRRFALALPVLAVLAVPTVGCESDDADPTTSSVVGPKDPSGDDSTTSSLPDPGFTAPPNPAAGGDGAETSAP